MTWRSRKALAVAVAAATCEADIPDIPLALDRNDAITPNSWRAQHGEVIEIKAFGQVTRSAQSPLDRYALHRHIAKRQYDAGNKFIADYELGVLGALDTDAHGSTGGTPCPITEARIFAMESYRSATKALGPRLEKVILAVCIAECKLADMKRRFGYERHGAMEIIRLGLDTLADHYMIPLDNGAQFGHKGVTS